MSELILTIIKMFLPAVLIVTAFTVIYLAVKIDRYKRSDYFSKKNIGFLKLLGDKGAYGEYLTYDALRHYESKGARFIYNCYLPKSENETSETDVIMIYKSGLYVFESKNYSGWIFGDEKSKSWTQTLPQGKNRKALKEHFYNPIKQNETHIKWLKEQLSDMENLEYHSIIVFSERCTLKKITVTSEKIKVIKRSDLSSVVRTLDEKTINTLTQEQTDRIYDILFPFTQVTDEQKQQHIKNINSKKLS